MNMLDRAQKAWTQSKLWWTAIVLIQLTSGSIAAWFAWTRPEHGVAAVTLPILGVLIPGITLFARAQAGSAYASGEAWRRAFLLKDSLHYEPDAGEYATLLLDADATGPNLQRAPTGGYYASTLPPGYPRLLENIAESAYYTTNLASVMARFCMVIVVLAVGVLCLVVVMALNSPLIDPTPAPDAASWVARYGPQLGSLASVVLAFFATGQIVEIGLVYSSLASTSRSVMQRALQGGVMSPGAVLSVLGLHEAALAGAGLPVPDILARVQSEALNQGWADIRSRTKSRPVAKNVPPSSS